MKELHAQKNEFDSILDTLQYQGQEEACSEIDGSCHCPAHVQLRQAQLELIQGGMTPEKIADLIIFLRSLIASVFNQDLAEPKE